MQQGLAASDNNSTNTRTTHCIRITKENGTVTCTHEGTTTSAYRWYIEHPRFLITNEDALETDTVSDPLEKRFPTIQARSPCELVIAMMVKCKVVMIVAVTEPVDHRAQFEINFNEGSATVFTQHDLRDNDACQVHGDGPAKISVASVNGVEGHNPLHGEVFIVQFRFQQRIVVPGELVQEEEHANIDTD